MSTPQPVTLQPVAPTSRSLTLDALRGFALFGVLIVNLLQAYSVVESAADRNVALLVRLLGEGTFYPIFSFLFGLGFALQLRKGEAALPLFRRRLSILLVIGLVHGVLIWYGDILTLYALVGFLLPRFRRASAQGLLTVSLVGWGAALLILSLGASDFAPQVLDNTKVYANRSYAAITAVRASEFALTLLSGLVLGGQVLALFLLGLLVGRRGVETVERDTRWLRRVGLGSLAVAFPLSLWYVSGSGEGILYVLEYLVASPLLGFAYLAGLSLFMLTPLGRAVMTPFSYVGRMALSNYLGQSVVCTFIFYGYGLGYYGELGAQDTLLIGLAIFAFQLGASYLWLRAFRYGPAEWVWRSLTYEAVQPVRRATLTEK